LYGDVMAKLDWSVGQILDRLKRSISTGGRLSFRERQRAFYGGSTGGLRGMKSQCWEGGLRVPLIARFPRSYPPATSAANRRSSWTCLRHR
jgi:arylsulfatase A-like enzyme